MRLKIENIVTIGANNFINALSPGILILSLFLLSFSQNTQAQAGVQFSFGGPQDDMGRGAYQTSDKGYLILGRTQSFGQGSDDILLTKTDSLGNILWSKTFGTALRDVGYNLKEDHSGGYISVNWVVHSGSSYDDWYILRFDDNGNVVQEQFIGGTDDDEIMNFDLTSDGGYIFAGSSRSVGLDGVDSWIVKTDASLNPLWNKTYTTGQSEHSRSIQETSSGNYAYLGNTGPGGVTIMNFFIMYLNSTGDTIWAKQAGGTQYDYGRDAIIANDGNFLYMGNTNSYGVGGYDILLFKITPAGNVLWAKTYGGAGNDEAYQISRSLDGNYMIAGTTTSFGVGDDLMLLNVNDNGDLIMANSVGGSQDDGIPYLAAALDSGYVITTGSSSYGAGGQDVLVIKTDKYGNSCCTQPITGLVVQNISLDVSPISVDTSSGMILPSHTIISSNISSLRSAAWRKQHV
ncbi:MAG: hypothetical protein ABFS05_03585 [Bacteroidota bacterium]